MRLSTIMLILGTIVLILGTALAGCAQIPAHNPPVCENFTLFATHGRGGELLYVLDGDNLELLRALITGLRDGTCRLER